MANVISALVIIILFCAASGYIYKEKKKGTKCIGCPMSGACHKSMKCESKHKSQTV